MKRTFQPCTCSIGCDEEKGHCQETKKQRIVAVVDDTSLFREFRSLWNEQIKTTLMDQKEHYVDRFFHYPIHGRTIISSWHFIDIWWGKISNPIYRKYAFSVLRDELSPQTKQLWKFYCLLKMVCK